MDNVAQIVRTSTCNTSAPNHGPYISFQLTLHWLWGEEVVDLRLDIVARLHHAHDLSCVLDDDTPWKVRESLTKHDALVAKSASDIDKDDCVFVGILANSLLERECIKPHWQASSTQMHPLHEKSEVTRVTLQPLEWMVLGLVALLPWRIYWIGRILVVVTLEITRHCFEGLLQHSGAAQSVSDSTVLKLSILTSIQLPCHLDQRAPS